MSIATASDGPQSTADDCDSLVSCEVSSNSSSRDSQTSALSRRSFRRRLADSQSSSQNSSYSQKTASKRARRSRIARASTLLEVTSAVGLQPVSMISNESMNFIDCCTATVLKLRRRKCQDGGDAHTLWTDSEQTDSQSSSVCQNEANLFDSISTHDSMFDSEPTEERVSGIETLLEELPSASDSSLGQTYSADSADLATSPLSAAADPDHIVIRHSLADMAGDRSRAPTNHVVQELIPLQSFVSSASVLQTTPDCASEGETACVTEELLSLEPSNSSDASTADRILSYSSQKTPLSGSSSDITILSTNTTVSDEQHCTADLSTAPPIAECEAVSGDQPDQGSGSNICGSAEPTTHQDHADNPSDLAPKSSDSPSGSAAEENSATHKSENQADRISSTDNASVAEISKDASQQHPSQQHPSDHLSTLNKELSSTSSISQHQSPLLKVDDDFVVIKFMLCSL